MLWRDRKTSGFDKLITCLRPILRVEIFFCHALGIFFYTAVLAVENSSTIKLAIRHFLHHLFYRKSFGYGCSCDRLVRGIFSQQVNPLIGEMGSNLTVFPHELVTAVD